VDGPGSTAMTENQRPRSLSVSLRPSQATKSVRFGVLGGGYVGQAAARALLSGFADTEVSSAGPLAVTMTYRSRAPTEGKDPRIEWHRLELSHDVNPVRQSSQGFEDCVALFQGCRTLLVTLPVAGGAQGTPRFFELLEHALERIAQSGSALCVLSSTSAYVQHSGVVTESSPWSADNPRFLAEERLRQRLGATILPLAGLFGDGRDPLRWIAEGRISDLRGAVNLIHHVDAGHCVAQVLMAPRSGERINISSGELHWWARLALENNVLPPGVSRTEVAALAASVGSSPGAPPPRLISNDKLLQTYESLRHHVFLRVGQDQGTT
jgi:nucleoside-diphosphate-sugar epimerase